MDILNQIQPPYDESIIPLFAELQARSLGLKDFPKETVTRLTNIIRDSSCEEVKTIASDIRNSMKNECVSQMAALRQNTRMALAERFPDVEAHAQVIEAAFHKSFTTTMSEFAAKSGVYLDRCVEVVESLRPKFALLCEPDAIKEEVATAVKAMMGAESDQQTNGDASQPSSQPSQPSQASQPSLAKLPTMNCSARMSRSNSATGEVDCGSSSSSDDTSSDSESMYEESVVSDTSIDSDEFKPKRQRLGPLAEAKRKKALEEKRAAKMRLKEDKMQARSAKRAKCMEEKTQQAQLKKSKRAEMNRLKREEKEKVKEARKKLRADSKQAKIDQKNLEKEEKRKREEKARSQWGSWLSMMGNKRTPRMRLNDGATVSGHDEKFSKAFAAAERRIQSEPPLSPTYIPGPEFTFSGSIPSSSSSARKPEPKRPATPVGRIPAHIPCGGVRANESLLDLFARLEKIVPYIGSTDGALRFLGASTVDEGKKNYKRMLLAVHTDKLGMQETADIKKRACELVDALNKSKAAILECGESRREARIPHAPRCVTSQVDSSRVVVLSWEPSSGATRYEVAIYDGTSDRYHIISVCEPDYDVATKRYKTLEECTTTTLAPASFPKLLHLWYKESMKVQVCAVSHKGVKSAPANHEVLMTTPHSARSGPYSRPASAAPSAAGDSRRGAAAPSFSRPASATPSAAADSRRGAAAPSFSRPASTTSSNSAARGVPANAATGVPPLRCRNGEDSCTPPSQGVAATGPSSNNGSSGPTPTRTRKAWEKV